MLPFIRNKPILLNLILKGECVSEDQGILFETFGLPGLKSNSHELESKEALTETETLVVEDNHDLPIAIKGFRKCT